MKTDVKGKKDIELQKMLTDARNKLRSLGFTFTGANNNVKEHRNLRKRIAQILTELRSRKQQ